MKLWNLKPITKLFPTVMKMALCNYFKISFQQHYSHNFPPSKNYYFEASDYISLSHALNSSLAIFSYLTKKKMLDTLNESIICCNCYICSTRGWMLTEKPLSSPCKHTSETFDTEKKVLTFVRKYIWDFTGNYEEVSENRGKCWGCNWWKKHSRIKNTVVLGTSLVYRSPQGASSGVQEFLVKTDQCKKRASFKRRRLGETASLPSCLLFLCTSLCDEFWSGIRFRIWFTRMWWEKALKMFLDQFWERWYSMCVIISYNAVMQFCYIGIIHQAAI